MSAFRSALKNDSAITDTGVTSGTFKPKSPVKDSFDFTRIKELLDVRATILGVLALSSTSSTTRGRGDTLEARRDLPFRDMFSFTAFFD